MKKTSFIFISCMLLLLMNTGCGDKGKNNTSSKDSMAIKDSTAKDTTKSDPSKFSDPH